MRAGGCGIPAFYTPAGVGTLVADGGLPWKYNADGSRRDSVAEERDARRSTDATTCSSMASCATLRSCAHRLPTPSGNVIFHKATRNFNPLCAMAGKITIVETEELVQPGEIDPEYSALAGHLRAAHRRSRIARQTHRTRHHEEALMATNENTACRTRCARTARRTIRQPRHRLADADSELRARRA